MEVNISRPQQAELNQKIEFQPERPRQYCQREEGMAVFCVN
ncbi:hypothetical protein ACNKHT_23210 [Shigella flexneri]